jgi:thiamine pyrophosphate-dependent acetolactate synthase large subunit-like protein
MKPQNHLLSNEQLIRQYKGTNLTELEEELLDRLQTLDVDYETLVSVLDANGFSTEDLEELEQQLNEAAESKQRIIELELKLEQLEAELEGV